MPGFIPTHDSHMEFHEILDLGGEYIDGVIWLPYEALFPMGSTLDQLADERSREASEVSDARSVAC